MQITRTRVGWTVAVIAGLVGIVAWPLATGAGLTLSVAAIFAGFRAVAAVAIVIVIVVVLAAAGLRIDADERGDQPPASAHRPR